MCWSNIRDRLVVHFSTTSVAGLLYAIYTGSWTSQTSCYYCKDKGSLSRWATATAWSQHCTTRLQLHDGTLSLSHRAFDTLDPFDILIHQRYEGETLPGTVLALASSNSSPEFTGGRRVADNY
jgi:hypothetical protein